MSTFKSQSKGGMHPIIRSAWYQEVDHVRAKGKFVQMTTKELVKLPTAEGAKKETVLYTLPPCICGIPDYYGKPNTILVVFHPKLGLAPTYVEVAIGEDILADLDVARFSDKDVKDLKWVVRFYEVA